MSLITTKGAKASLFAAALTLLPAAANAADALTLKADDYVGISFWLISMALVAATAFFFIETTRVQGKWKTSLTVSGLVTLIAAVHYFYMRDVWVATGETPTVYRYIDWLITVPLLMVEFYLILRASHCRFWRHFLASDDWYTCDARRWLCWRSWLYRCMGRLSSSACSVGPTFCMKSLQVKPAVLPLKKHRHQCSQPFQQCVGLYPLVGRFTQSATSWATSTVPSAMSR